MTGTDRNGREAVAGRGELRDGTAAVVWPRRAGAWLGAIAVGLALTTMVVVILAAFWETRLALSAVRLAAAETAAEAIADDLDHAIALGIPLDRLPGLDTYLDQRMTRLSELRFMAILDSRGVAFHRAGIGRRLEDVLAGVGGGFDPERQGVSEVDGYLIVSLPLRGGAGWVLVASQPAQISQNLMDDLLSTVPFWLGCLVLVGWWAWIMAERGLAEPARVLGRIMRRAVGGGGGGGGRFDTLIVRRTRDAVGDCQWAVNAIAAGLHARERNFLQQAEEVRAAVFEPAVAAKVVELRYAVVGSSNGIGGPPPRRVHGTRRHDADPFAGMVVPAAGLGVVGAFAMASRLEGAPAMGGMALAGLLVLLAGLCAGLSVGRRCVSPRRTALGTVALAAASLIATAALLGTLPKTEAEAATLPLAGGLVAIMGGVIGVAVALATRCRERWAADAGVGGDTGTVGAWGTAALVGVASLGVGYGLINSPLGVFVAGICLCVPAAISALVGGFRMEPAEEPTDGVGRGGEGRAGEGRG